MGRENRGGGPQPISSPPLFRLFLESELTPKLRWHQSNMNEILRFYGPFLTEELTVWDPFTNMV